MCKILFRSLKSRIFDKQNMKFGIKKVKRLSNFEIISYIDTESKYKVEISKKYISLQSND
jgi:hypothetical protein